MKKCILIIILFISFAPRELEGSEESYFSLGSGISSSYSGRFVPGLSVGAGTRNIGISLYGAGVKTDAYQHETVQLCVYYYWEIKNILGKVRISLGLGKADSFRTYEDPILAEKEIGNESSAGIASSLSLVFFERFFVSLNTLNGKGARSSRLIFKPFAQFILGINF